MNKFVITVLLSLVPAIVFAADGALTFAPPASDYSVIFLGNLFGVVDGVLRGTGSQIMGAIFAVFNSAVLALGGIVIMYTLIVSTMNTAHEGQMLGQKWSSIWVPLRSVMGLALLVPKASGYCLMQIIVMWIVVQGIGAADKVWDAALSYLNRGGVIIQAQANPGEALTQSASSGVSEGAATILSGQVCMIGLQKQLEAQRQSYLKAKQNNTGPCSGAPLEPMSTFCNSAVSDFIGTVNAVMVQNKDKNAITFSVPMPNFAAAPWNVLNGICGSLSWNSIPGLSVNLPEAGNKGNVGQLTNFSASEMDTAKMSRAIAIQQMYLNLATLAQVIVNNNPAISQTSNSSGETKDYSLVAKQQFGVPYTKNGTECTNYDKTCVIWGPASGSAGGGVLFRGTEFQGAIADYNGVMMPTLNLLKQTGNAANANAARQFITNASTQGWLMAGSYFFDLVRIQGSSAPPAKGSLDTETGLNKSVFELNTLISPFGQGGCVGTYSSLCVWFDQDNAKVNQVVALINGSMLTTNSSGIAVLSDPVPKPDLKDNPTRPLINGLQSSTVYGFINNSAMVQLPGQPGLKPLLFSNAIDISVDPKINFLMEQSFPCGEVKIAFFSFCLGQMMGNLFYNIIVRYMYNFFMAIFQQLINQVIMAFLMIPLVGMSEIFKQGMATLQQPGVNPIVALANMGIMYINFSSHLWLILLTLSITTAIIPLFGIVIFAVIALALPLLLAWVGIMVGIGFITAYYIPILPYMIFTFGVIAWLIAVIEAMVAAPIVALGITHPEGDQAFGKGEHAIFIIMNVFLRPAMMIIGYIAGIALSYVGVWILNAGFDNAISYIQQGRVTGNTGGEWGFNPELHRPKAQLHKEWDFNRLNQQGSGAGGIEGASRYTEWAGVYAFFFSILSYTTIYLIIVQKAFTLISYLPDKVLRWIGGAPEGIGEQAAQWGDEVKQAGKEAGKETQTGQAQIDKQLGGYGQKALGLGSSGLGSGGGGSVGAKGGLPKGLGDAGEAG